MNRTGARMGSWLFVVLVSVGTAKAADPRFSLFERYNRASTRAELTPLLSGTLARQFAAIGSNEEELQRALKTQHVTSYKSRIVEIDEKTSFVVVEDVGSGRQQEAQAYLVTKGAGGDWTLANRFLPGSIIKTLWTDTFAAAQFNQASRCSIDGQELGPKSALAIRQKDVIRIRLYPFPFSESDVDYWRQAGGLPATDDRSGGHFADANATACILTLELDQRNGVSFFNVGQEPGAGASTHSKVWQAPKSDIARIEIAKNRIVIDTSGQVGTETDGVRWSVKVDLPLWERGL